MSCWSLDEPFGLITRADLRRCIDDGQLQLHYQPVVDLVGGAVSAVEAVLRWQDPHLGWVQPEEFLALVEASGLTNHLGFWVLETASVQMAQWRSAGAHWGLSVAASPDQLQYPPYLNGLQRMFTEDLLEPRQLTLVFSVAELSDGARQLRQLAWLSARGVKFALDGVDPAAVDSGWLQSLPVNEIRLIKSSHGNHEANTTGKIALISLMAAAHRRRLRVVGMHVETRRNYRALQALGLDLAQGEFICPPMEGERLLEHLSRSGAIQDATCWR